MNSVPAVFASDRLALLGPLITPRAIELARLRVLNPKSRLVDNKGGVGGESPADVKVALMLARIINPCEDFTNPEEAHYRGMTPETFGKRKSSGEL